MMVWRLLLEFIIVFFSAWTLAYHVFLLLRLPARLIFLPFFVILIPLTALTFRNQSATLKYLFQNRKEHLFAASSLLLLLFSLILSIVLPQSEDQFFFFFSSRPAFLTAAGFFTISFMIVLIWRKRLVTSRFVTRTDVTWFTIGVTILSLLTAIFCLVQYYPQADDFGFVHRALIQLEYLDRPFFTTDTKYNVQGMYFSNMHLLTAYEYMMVLFGHYLGVDVLRVYMNVSALLAGALLPLVYVLLYRKLRLNRMQALLAASFAIAFLILEGNVYRSFGLFTLLRFWQGKTILIGLCIPIIFFFAVRFLHQPSIRKFSILTLAGICAVGLSPSCLFLVPTLIFALSLAYVLSYGFSRKRFKRAIVLNFTTSYIVLVILVLLLGLLVIPIDVTTYDVWKAKQWRDNLNLVFDGSLASLIRNICILFVVPLVMLKRPFNRFLVFFSLILILVFANPVTGPLLIKKIHTSAFWRLAYLFPLPLSAGLIVLPLTGLFHNIQRISLKTATSILACGLILIAFQKPAFIALRTPWSYQLKPHLIAFSRLVSPHLDHKNVLALSEIVTTLGMIKPALQFEVTTKTMTRHHFLNSGLAHEAQRRLKALKFLEECGGMPELEAAFQQSLQRGVNAVIAKDCRNSRNPTAIKDNLDAGPGVWREAARSTYYVLYLRSE